MSYSTPDTFRRDWHYELDKDFSKDGQTAVWAYGYPSTWGSEDYSFKANGELHGGAFSPDGKFLAVIMGGDVKIYLANENDFKLCETLNGPTERVTKVEWQPTAPGKKANGYLLLSDLNTQNYGPTPKESPQIVLWPLSANGHYHTGPIGEDPNVKAVAGAAALEVSDLLQKRYRWSVEEATDEKIRTAFEATIEAAAKRHRVSSATQFEGQLFSFGSRAFSYSGKSVIVSTKSGPGNPQQGEAKPYIDVWDIEPSVPYRRLRLEGHTDNIMWVGTDPADKVIASSCWDATVKIWDFETGDLIHTLGPSGGQNWTGVFSPDSRFFAHGCGGKGLAVQVWDVRSGTNITKVTNVLNWARALAWSPDGETLAIGASRGVVNLIDPRTGDVKQDWRLRLGNSFGSFQEIGGMQYIDEGKRISFKTGADGGIEVYDMEKNKKWRVAPAEGNKDGSWNGQCSAVWWQAKQMLVAFDGDNVVRFWKME